MVKKELVILHGALGSAQQFEACIPFLTDQFNIHFIDFPGHGNNDLNLTLSIENCASYLKDQIADLNEPHIFGYSMGGYVALYGKITNKINPVSIITLATKFEWTPEFAKKETDMMDLGNLMIIAPTFIDNLKVLHGDKWEMLLENTRKMMQELGNNKLLTDQTLKGINCPVCISVGFKDKMVSIEESLWAARNIPKAEFEVYPKLQHPAERINWKQVSFGIKHFVGVE